MARMTNQSPAATRRTSRAADVQETNGKEPLDGTEGRRNEPSHPVESSTDTRTSRADVVRNPVTTADRAEHDMVSEQRDRHENRAMLDEGDSGANRGFDVDRDRGAQGQRDERREQDQRRDLRPAMSAGSDPFAPVLQAWTQLFRSWSELAGTMVKMQQDAVATMMGAATSGARAFAPADRDRHNDGLHSSRTDAGTFSAREQDRR